MRTPISSIVHNSCHHGIRTWLLSKTSWLTSFSNVFGGLVCCRTLYCRKDRKLSNRYCPTEKATIRRFHGKPGRSSDRARRCLVCQSSHEYGTVFHGLPGANPYSRYTTVQKLWRVLLFSLTEDEIIAFKY